MGNSKKTASRPYIMQQYNMLPLMLNITPDSLLARLVNNVIEGLNATNKMPRILLVIIDQALVRDINYFKYGLSKRIAKDLTYLIKQTKKAVDRRKDLMRELKPGSLMPSEPKFIYMKMFDRPFPGKFIAQCEKFNAVLEEILAGQNNHYILDVNDVMTRNCFDRYNNITNNGIITMWMEIDRQLQGFDEHKKEHQLIPQPVVSTARAHQEEKKRKK